LGDVTEYRNAPKRVEALVGVQAKMVCWGEYYHTTLLVKEGSDNEDMEIKSIKFLQCMAM
jgi:hypothetical protein